MAHRMTVAESQRGRWWLRAIEFVALVVVLAGVLASIAVGVWLAQP